MNENKNNNSIQGVNTKSNEEALKLHVTPRVKRVFEKANKISLTNDEKLNGANELVKFMEDNAAGAGASRVWNIKSPYVNTAAAFFASLSTKRKVLVPIAALLIFTLGIGTTYASGGALPGDALYVVKIGVKEKVESLLALDSETKARVAAAQATERLFEVEKLAEQGRLDATLQADLEASFTRKVAEFNENEEALMKEGDIEAVLALSSEFETALSDHKKSLTVVKSYITSASERRINFEASAASTSVTMQKKNSAQSALAVSKEKIEKVEGYISNASRSASVVTRVGVKSAGAENNASTTIKIEADLADIKKTLTEGQSRFSTGAYGEAYLLFKKADEDVDKINNALQVEHKKAPLPSVKDFKKDSQKSSTANTRKIVDTHRTVNGTSTSFKNETKDETSVQVATTSDTISSGASIQSAGTAPPLPAQAPVVLPAGTIVKVLGL